MSTKPKDASTPPKMCKASDEASNLSSDGQRWRLIRIQGIDISQEKNSTKTASETQDNAANSDVVTKTEDSPEEVAAKALVEEYMNRYANVYSKELLFAIDVMTLVRYLNGLDSRYIMYATNGIAPTSPCDDTLDQAIRKMWADLEKGHGHKFVASVKKRKNRHLFQELILRLARTEEKEEWDNEKSFLRYCLVLAQCAACAERNGLTDASEFIPLVICRTIQKRKDSGEFPVNFWERIAKLALDITDGSESP